MLIFGILPADQESLVAAPQTSVRSDFIADLRALLERSLVAQGFTVAAGDDAEALLVRHLNVQQRKIQARTRPVVLSEELRQRLARLTTEQREALGRIETASLVGEDLTPYLSRKVVGKKKRGDFNDRLLCEWNIHHMHLGRGLDPDGKVTGTQEVLFVVARDEALYFVEVFDHAFEDDRLFEILRRNWPAFVSAFGSVPAPRTAVESSAETRAAARAAGVNMLTVAAGRAYSPLGGGISTDGSSSRVRREADRILDELNALEASHHANADAIAEGLRGMTGTPCTVLHLKLIAVDGVLHVVETTTGVELRDARGNSRG